MTTLGSMSVGSIVKIKENGEVVNYIIVHKGLPSSMYSSSCDGVWLLREKTFYGAWHGTTSGDSVNDYGKSDINTRLNGTFLSTIETDVRAAIKWVRIPYMYGKGNESSVWSGSDGLSCKVFLLSGYEVGYTIDTHKLFPKDGAKLSYFSNNTSRKADNQWWLRSPLTSNGYLVWYVASDGNAGNTTTDLWHNGVRPAFILPTSLKVDSYGYFVFNTAPTISGSSSSGSSMGEVSAPFNFTYTVSDADNDTVTVNEYIDDVLQRSYTATLGATNTFRATSNSEAFQKLLNGSHTLKVIATDSAGNSSSAYTVSFNKQVKSAVITLSTPLPADDLIKAAVISVTGNIPQDAALEILVTNNALDDAPVWEDMTQDYEKQINHVFSNKTAANGFAFNFKVTATRGVSEEQGYISNIGGAFE